MVGIAFDPKWVKVKPPQVVYFSDAKIHCAGCALKAKKEWHTFVDEQGGPELIKGQLAFEKKIILVHASLLEPKKKGADVVENYLKARQAKRKKKHHAWLVWARSIGFGVVAITYQVLEIMHLMPSLTSGLGFAIHLSFLALLLPIVVLAVKDAIQAMQKKNENGEHWMHSLVVLAIGLAYGSSLYASFASFYHLKFMLDSHLCCLLFILAMLPLRSIIQSWALRMAQKKHVTKHALFKNIWVRRLCGHQVTFVERSQIQVGDEVVVPKKERVLFNGVIQSIASSKNKVRLLDRPALGGDLTQKILSSSDQIQQGDVLDADVRIKVTSSLKESAMGVIFEQPNDLGQDRRMKDVVNRMTRWVMALMSFFLITTPVMWLIHGSISLALSHFIGVLGIVCPCCIMLAFPLLKGFVVRVLSQKHMQLGPKPIGETWAKATHMVFDVSGTLTKRAVEKIEVSSGINAQEAMAMLLSMELSVLSQRPSGANPSLARIMVKALRKKIKKDSVKAMAGCVFHQGVLSVTVKGDVYRVSREGANCFVLKKNDQDILKVDLNESIHRPAWAVLKRALDTKKQVVLLSGSSKEAIREWLGEHDASIQASLGIVAVQWQGNQATVILENDQRLMLHAQASPKEKARHLHALCDQENVQVLSMFDGANDLLACKKIRDKDCFDAISVDGPMSSGMAALNDLSLDAMLLHDRLWKRRQVFRQVMAGLVLGYAALGLFLASGPIEWMGQMIAPLGAWLKMVGWSGSIPPMYAFVTMAGVGLIFLMVAALYALPLKLKVDFQKPVKASTLGPVDATFCREVGLLPSVSAQPRMSPAT